MRKELLLSALNAVGEGVAVVDETGRFVYFNRAAERILGMGPIDGSADEWSATYGVYLADEKTPFPTESYPLVRALRGEETNGIEMFVRNAQVPQGVHIAVTGRPIHDEASTIKGAVVVFRDITEHKQFVLME